MGHCELGRWTDWVVYAKWSSGADGLLQVWKDKDRVFVRSGQNKFADDKGHYMKFGIYKWDWLYPDRPTDATERILYFDEIRIADSSGSLAVVSPK